MNDSRFVNCSNCHGVNALVIFSVFNLWLLACPFAKSPGDIFAIGISFGRIGSMKYSRRLIQKARDRFPGAGLSCDVERMQMVCLTCQSFGGRRYEAFSIASRAMLGKNWKLTG